MRGWPFVILTCALLLSGATGVGAAESLPPVSDIQVAHPALRFNPLSRCPQIRQTSLDEAGAAVVLLLVGPTGVPSHASVRSPPSSDGLDAAATSCVLTLRFQPATRIGDGAAIDSWQEIAWKWAPAHNAPAATASPAAPVAAAAPAAAAADAAAVQRSPGAAGAAEVRVCVDESGRLVQPPALVHSSGDSAFDAAALAFARSGAAAKPAAGCMRMTIGREH
jgi:outer membrane biosynthesis protein TonB